MKKYYVVYTGRDIGYYKTTYWIVCITEDEEVAKDLCQKFNYRYAVETVGKERSTPDWVKNKEEATR